MEVSTTYKKQQTYQGKNSGHIAGEECPNEIKTSSENLSSSQSNCLRH